MAVTINGNGTVTGLSALPSSAMASKTVIQSKCTPTNTEAQASTSSDTYTDITGIDLLFTPLFANSTIILITFTAQIRLNPDAEGYVGIYYSPNSNMSSPVILDPVRGASRNESFRVNSNDGDAHHFWTITQTTWDTTVSNTNARYYSVGGYRSNNENIYYGDQGVGLTMMAQEIKT